MKIEPTMFGRLPVIWRRSMVTISVCFATAIYNNVIRPSSPIGVAQFITLITYALTLAEFGIGDSRLLDIIEMCWSEPRIQQIRTLARHYAIFDAIFAFAHLALLALMSWFATMDTMRFAYLLLILTGLNVLWLSIRLMCFSQVIELETDHEFRKVLRLQRYTAFCWLVLNAIYVIAVGFVFMAGTSSGPAFINTVLALGGLRALVDGLCGWKLYGAAITGGDEKED